MNKEQKLYYNYGYQLGKNESYTTVSKLLHFITSGHKEAHKQIILNMLIQMSTSHEIPIPRDLMKSVDNDNIYSIAMGLQNAIAKE